MAEYQEVLCGSLRLIVSIDYLTSRDTGGQLS